MNNKEDVSKKSFLIALQKNDISMEPIKNISSTIKSPFLNSNLWKMMNRTIDSIGTNAMMNMIGEIVEIEISFFCAMIGKIKNGKYVFPSFVNKGRNERRAQIDAKT